MLQLKMQQTLTFDEQLRQDEACPSVETSL